MPVTQGVPPSSAAGGASVQKVPHIQTRFLNNGKSLHPLQRMGLAPSTGGPPGGPRG